MFSTLFPPPSETPTSRIANPRGAQGGRLRMRHTRAVSLNDPDGLLEIVGVCAGMTQD